MSDNINTVVSTDDLRSLAWLCEMAALGCLDTNRSAWAAQLRLDAQALRRRADAAEGRTPSDATRACPK